MRREILFFPQKQEISLGRTGLIGIRNLIKPGRLLPDDVLGGECVFLLWMRDLASSGRTEVSLHKDQTDARTELGLAWTETDKSSLFGEDFSLFVHQCAETTSVSQR